MSYDSLISDLEKSMEAVNEDTIKEVITSLADSVERDLFALSETELAERWYFKWNDKASIAWNIYQFTDMIGLHSTSCRRWEEHHNGSCCVVERVRDKYLMPRIRAFEAELKIRMAEERGAGDTMRMATGSA